MGSNLAVVVGLVAVLLSTAVPKRYGPVVALALFIVLPRFVFSDSSALQAVPPASWVLIVWLLRLARGAEVRNATRRALLALIVAFCAWGAFTVIWSSAITTSAGWLVPFALVTVPLIIGAVDRPSMVTLRRGWLVLAALVAVYGLVEFILSSNVVYDYLRAVLAEPLVRSWSVYRVNASFGHPLYAALFYAVSAAFAYGIGIRRGGIAPFVVAALCSAATVATFSRAGIASLAIALVSQTVLATFTRSKLRFFGKLGVSLLLVAGAFAAFQVPQLQERLLSEEALTSSAARDILPVIASSAAEAHSYLGSGIGTSATAIAPFNPEGLLMENGYLQLFVSSGVIGVVLFAAVLLTALLGALRRVDIAGFGSMLAFSIMIGTFNGVESNPGFLMILGFVLAMIVDEKGNHDTAPQQGPLRAPALRPDKAVRAGGLRKPAADTTWRTK